MKWKKIIALSLATGLILPASNAAALTNGELYDEMRLPHDGYPHGVPHDYSWYGGPGYRDLAFPTTVYEPVSAEPHTWNAYVPWGQVFEAEEGSSANNTRVQIKDIQAYYLSAADNRWHRTFFEPAPVGGFYREDFAGDEAIAGSVRNEADGGISVIPGAGRVFHFFPGTRAVVDNPDDVLAIYGTYQARLVPDDPFKPDDRGSARFVANAGIDLWYDGGVGWDNFKTNGDTGISRFRYVTNDFQFFSAYSAKPGFDITAAPPPPAESSPPPPPSFVPPGAYVEDFDDGLAQSWSLPEGMSVGGGNLHSDRWDVAPVALYAGRTFKGNYTYKIDVKTGAGDNGNRSKVLFNAVDQNNYYALDIGGGPTPYIYIRKTVKGRIMTIASTKTRVPIAAGAPATFEITYETGGYISVKATLRGKTVTMFDKVRDETFSSGKIGVAVRASVTQFDNIVAYAPPEYAEDFNDDQAQNWTLPEGISVGGGSLHTDEWGIHPFALYTGQTFNGTYTLKLDVKTVAGDDGNRTKIVFNAKDANNYYYLDLGGGKEPNIYLKKVAGGTESTIATSPARTSIMSDTYTSVEITYVAGGTIGAKAIQGGKTTTLFDKVSDRTFPSGRIGVTVHASVSQFDNFFVVYPGE